MKFVKKHVPDKRWNNKKRPVMVKGNPLFWFFWKIISITKSLMNRIKLLLEKSFTEIDDVKEEGYHDRREEE